MIGLELNLECDIRVRGCGRVSTSTEKHGKIREVFPHSNIFQLFPCVFG